MSLPRSSSRGPGSSGGTSSASKQRTSTSVAAAASQTQPSAFFVKERERIITEIADGMEQILGNVNTINRKLEESVAVGQEFEPIANLWGPFMDMLTGHGLVPTSDGSNADAGTIAHDALKGSSTAPLPASFDGPNVNRLPPGVAPGGGTVYGMSS
jgi:DASH complex subunit DAD1